MNAQPSAIRNVVRHPFVTELGSSGRKKCKRFSVAQIALSGTETIETALNILLLC